MNDAKESIFSSLDIREPNQAFENAIKRGLKNPQDYMYMYSDKGKDYFKHIDTRQYTSFRNSDKPSVIESLKGRIKAAKEKSQTQSNNRTKTTKENVL